MAASCEARYISTACNRTPGSLSWGKNNLICFGACNSVALYNPKDAKITNTLCHHKGRVNAVKWVQTPGSREENLSEIEIVSVSSDKTGIVWSKDGNNLFQPSAILTGHSDVVTVVDAIYLPHSSSNKYPALLVVTGSADSSAKIWIRNSGNKQINCSDTLCSGSGLYLSIKLCLLPNTNTPLLAIATDDAKIHLYSVATEPPLLCHVHALVGHEDWIRCIDFTVSDDGDILLASGGQDMLIRIWRLSPRCGKTNDSSSDEFDPSKEIKLEEEIFSISSEGVDSYWAATVDSVLAGHEGWVYSVCWHPKIIDGSGHEVQPLYLLSASLDKTMVLWTPGLGNDEDSVWLEKARVGEVGGNTLGFYGCQFAPDGHSILAHGYQGSFHLWHLDLDTEIWQPGLSVGGHFDEVTDLGWEPGGTFVISVSYDQTSRLHAPWIQDGGKVSWHELARPQVHGYDIQCLAILSRYQYASGAEEKIVRVFKAPGNFIENFQRICGVQESNVDELLAAMPTGASVPSLGLSNKAVFNEDTSLPAGFNNQCNEFPEGYFTPVCLAEPPKEEDLLQNTLWPEIQKLYGHGYELYSLAASNNGKLLASACKASSSQHASIILWDAQNWQQLQKLQSHELTVTRLVFSPNDKYLLSVSRDRCWSIFENETNSSFKLVASTNKSNGIHTRIIWCCAWTHDSKFFSTGSREGKIVIWGGHIPTKEGASLGYWSAATAPLLLKESVTSLTFAPQQRSDASYMLGAGLENGHIVLYSWQYQKDDPWSLIASLNQDLAHHLTVKQLAFRPQLGDIGEKKLSVLLLASAGADHIVKIHAIPFDEM
ncbi:putative elongator complex protein 2 [Frankliniella fusca]|uniref:Elongator complex protein 2 n=1 Tax=Frankliniella fusca TaxID=407009 RepID=A0AAE1LU49_9NEOP|nr:putative elongator complex protein 2 [Frankliniella fusca]